MLKKLFIIFVALAFTAACTPAGSEGTGTTPTDAPPPEPTTPTEASKNSLSGTSWDLVAIGDQDISGQGFTLAFAADTLSGSDSCNEFGAPYTLSANTLSVAADEFEQTEEGCPEPISTLSNEYLSALATGGEITLGADQLTIETAATTLAFTASSTSESMEEGEFAPLTFEVLDNFTYAGIYEKAVTLENGRYEGDPFVEGSASRPTVTRLPEAAFGDLNGDAVEDAVVLLAENSGGSGTFIFAAAVLHRGATLENSSTILLGDRVIVESIAIEKGELMVEGKIHSNSDALCCPTQETVLVYHLNNNDELVLLRSEVVEATLNGRWQLHHTIVGGDAIVPPPANSDIFLDFVDDRVTGNVGCNNLNGSVTVDGNQMTFGALAITKKLCGDERDTYEQGMLEMLNNVTHYHVIGNALVLRNEDLPLAEFGQAAPTSPDLLNTVWQWVAFEDTAEVGSIDVPTPASYTLQFLPDGTYALTNDCNSGNGRYRANGSGELTLEPGLTTLVACGEESLDGEFGRLLGEVVTYVIEEGQLFLNLRLDSGNLVFVAAEE